MFLVTITGYNQVMLKEWTPEEKRVLRLYRNKCVCHPTRFAVTIHHSPPRSLNPNYENEPWTQFPVCHECHARAHDENIMVMHELLCDNRARFFPEVQEYFDALRSG